MLHPAKAPYFTSAYPRKKQNEKLILLLTIKKNHMDHHEVEILLIEDNIHEAELAIRSLKKNNLANRLKHIDDGADALDFIFSTGKYAGRTTPFNPKLILLDLKLPRVDGLEILRRLKSSESTNL